MNSYYPQALTQNTPAAMPQRTLPPSFAMLSGPSMATLFLPIADGSDSESTMSDLTDDSYRQDSGTEQMQVILRRYHLASDPIEAQLRLRPRRKIPAMKMAGNPLIRAFETVNKQTSGETHIMRPNKKLSPVGSPRRMLPVMDTAREQRWEYVTRGGELV